MGINLQGSPGAGNQDIQTQNISELQNKLKDIGLGDISWITLENISKDPEEKKALLEDIQKLLSKNPINQKERDYIETKYIKGFGQIVTFQGKEMPIFEVAQMVGKMSPEEKKKAIDGMGRTDRILFKDWEKTLAVKEGEKIDAGTQAIIERTETKLNDLITMEAALKGQVESLQQIPGVQKPNIEDLRENISQVPELSGKDISDTDIKEGKYDNILFATYYVDNKDAILKNIKPEDKERFTNSINSISDTLKRPRPVKWPDITEELALGSSRSKIKDAGDIAIRQGYDKSVTWDPSTRSLIFRGDKGVKAIETASIPPKERVIVGNLSISRELQSLSPERKGIETLMAETRKLQSEIGTNGYNAALTLIARVDTGSILKEAENSENKKAHIERLNRYQSSKKTLEGALTNGDTQTRLEAIRSMKQSNTELDYSRRDMIGEIIQKSLGSAESPQKEELDTLEGTLQEERTALERLDTLYTKIDTNVRQIKGLGEKIKKEPLDTFDSQARATLGYLNLIGYDVLGQPLLEKVIQSVNLEKKGIIAEIDLSKNPKLDTAQEKELLRAIARISRLAPSMGNWKNVDPDDEIIAYRQMRSSGGRVSLQEMMKTTSFQSVAGRNPEQFRSYLYRGDAHIAQENNLSALNTRGNQGEIMSA